MTLADDRNRAIAKTIGDGGYRRTWVSKETGVVGTYTYGATIQQVPLDFATLKPFFEVLWPWFCGGMGDPDDERDEVYGDPYSAICEWFYNGQIHLHLADARDLIADAVAQEGES